MNRAAVRRLAEVEARHWWYRGMRAIARTLLDGRRALGATLDAGCGTGGWLVDWLPDAAPAVGLDLQPYALEAARTAGLTVLVRGSVSALPFADRSFDTVTALDVVYHRAVRSDRRALAELYRVLRPGGRLLVQVPAYDWLRSRHDKEVETGRRYSTRSLRAGLEAAGFTVARLTHANALLLPIAVGWRVIERVLPPGPALDLALPPAPLNALARMALALERRWLAERDLPVGLSVLAVARRPAAASGNADTPEDDDRPDDH